MTTKLQQQIGPECALVTIAMLANKPIALIRRRALERSNGLTWAQVVNSDTQTFWSVMDYLYRFYNLADAVVTLKSQNMVIGSDLPVNSRPVTAVAPKLIGRGQLIFQHASGTHSVVVDSGVVFDGNLSQPLDMETYWQNVVIGQYGATRYWTKLKIKE